MERSFSELNSTLMRSMIDINMSSVNSLKPECATAGTKMTGCAARSCLESHANCYQSAGITICRKPSLRSEIEIVYKAASPIVKRLEDVNPIYYKGGNHMEKMKLLFRVPVFSRGLNVTVRRGCLAGL